MAVKDDDPKPQPPEAPEPLDCCGEGCVPCIYDVYDRAMEQYQDALAAWLARHPEASG
ncbi:oxidoreductase-like domain-containing protein [Dyella sp.]|uniref:oxidoreductase-like domain-containing protein n=1 Tax=Dyella sp. TaxID=1869338 RepID=UPI002D780524|nr:oxidoreductase-like domain-containing protein [Dyella sp.]HET6431297.1 oxidoreductase-like domain-containing protein [Dyella sp.]